MKEILVLGPGCNKCQKLHQHVIAAKEELGLDCEVIKVSDPAAIAGFGVMMTPSLMIDGELVASGKLLSVEQIKNLLEK